MTNLSDNRVVLGLSGGVDSTAAALLLKDKGLEVIGLYFDVQGNNEAGIAKAKKVADELGIKLIVKDASKEFENCIIKDFIDNYTHGKTPNPCVLCNYTIKFKLLIDTANDEQAKYIATGHYAKIKESTTQGCKVISMAENRKKDQSYMLYRLPKETIERLIFPLSEFDDKEETRNLARSVNMSNADDKDSQEICFIGDDETYIDFLDSRSIASEKGNFVDKNGNVLGEHKGIVNYTYGQRKGLGIALGKPAFVTNIDAKNNTVTLGDNEDLFANKITCENVFFTATGSSEVPEFVKNKKIKAKIRYASQPSPGIISDCINNEITVVFDEKQRAATPGQSLVIYFDDEVIGGGTIK